MEKRLTVLVPENMDGRMVKDVARSCLSLSSTRLKKAKRIPGGVTLNVTNLPSGATPPVLERD